VLVHAVLYCDVLRCAVLAQDEEDSKYAYNSDDDADADYGMANGMDL
jgi:hypothetical protein